MGRHDRKPMATASQPHVGVPCRTVVQQGDLSEKNAGSVSMCSSCTGIGMPTVIANGMFGCSGILEEKQTIGN